MSDTGTGNTDGRTPTHETVLVTGGSGYLAGWLIVALLQAGYRVRATLRSLSREDAVRAHVAGQVGSELASAERLSFHTADLLHNSGWPEAVAGCSFVLHVASPMGQGMPKGTDLVTPAREGTLRVLRAAAEAGVRRVVYTSSTITAERRFVPGQPVESTDEHTWTDPDRPGLSEYGRSKTLAERAAWEFIERDAGPITLTTILPGLIAGPVMTGSVFGSVEAVSRLLAGKVPALPRIGFTISEIRGLSEIYLRAMTAPEAANQRFLATGDFLWLADMARILRERFPAASGKVPTRGMPDFVVRLAALFQVDARFMTPLLGVRRSFSTAKAARLLDWHPRPAEEVIADCAANLIAQRLV